MDPVQQQIFNLNAKYQQMLGEFNVRKQMLLTLGNMFKENQEQLQKLTAELQKIKDEFVALQTPVAPASAPEPEVKEEMEIEKPKKSRKKK